MKYPIDVPVNVLSLGAGVQSSAMLFAYLNGDLKPMPDFAVFADTQSEPQKVYDWLEKLKGIAGDKLPILTPSRGSLVEDYLSAKDRYAAVPFFIKNQDGTQGMGMRQCTSEYKITVIKKAIRTELGYVPKERVKHHVNSLIGISVDEAQRMKDSQDKWNAHKYPLIEELDWDRTDCFEYVKKQGLGDPPKSACYICPYRSNESWRQMKLREPDAFKKAVEFEKAIQIDDTDHQSRHGGSKLDGTPFLHRSLVPLGELDFEAMQPNEPLFGNDCEGMCGV